MEQVSVGLFYYWHSCGAEVSVCTEIMDDDEEEEESVAGITEGADEVTTTANAATQEAEPSS